MEKWRKKKKKKEDSRASLQEKEKRYLVGDNTVYKKNQNPTQQNPLTDPPSLGQTLQGHTHPGTLR